MSKGRFLIFSIILIVLLSFLSCKKIKEPGTEESVKAQKPEVRQPESKTETKVQPQQATQSMGQLTEEEQKSFEGCLEPGILTQDNALKYLQILVKGDPETIIWYGEYEKDPNRRVIASKSTLYQSDICSNIGILSQEKNKDAHALILQVIEKKTEYPRARACAIMAINRYGDFKNGEWHGDKRSIPVLEKIVNDKDPEIRLHTAGALLSLGKGDIALPVLDEIAKAGIKESAYVFKKLFAPEEREIRGKKRIVLSDTKMWDKRGKDILIRALNYPGDEVKAFAAISLANMGIEKKSAEDTAISILERLKNRKKRDYKKADEWESNRNAGFLAIAVLEKIKSPAGINVLNQLVENNSDLLLKDRAKSALKKIQQK